MDFHRIKKIVQSEHTLSVSEWKGAVLFLCNQDHVFFIKRSEQMPTHGGQIAFVGGHKKETEAHPWIVAQREFEEETGLNSNIVSLLGYLPIVHTARMQPIIPVMGELLISTEEFIQMATSNGEWEDCLAYPWRELCLEENWEFAWRNGHAKSPVLFHAMRGGSMIPKSQELKTHLLWGATAYMVWDFLRLYYRHTDS